MLIFSHLADDYELVSVTNSITEARRLYNPARKQVFYFDDFLGATFYGDQVGQNQDRALLDFIAVIRGSHNARLIMTTREHILRQALDASERFGHSELIDGRCVLELTDYSYLDKARILYNHIYFSDLPSEYIAELLKGRFYAKIIEHQKFSPRLIEWLSTFRRLKDIPAQGYQKFVTDLLENPAEIWRFAYSNQISDAGRSLLLSLYLFGGTSENERLEKRFAELHRARSQKYGFRTSSSDWRRALRELGEAFVSIDRERVTFIDPSVIDLLNTIVREEPTTLSDLVSTCCNIYELDRLIALFRSRNLGRLEISDDLLRDTFVPALSRLVEASFKVEQNAIDAGAVFAVSVLLRLQEGTQSDVAKELLSATVPKFKAFCSDHEIDIGAGLKLHDDLKPAYFDSRQTSVEVKRALVSSMIRSAVFFCKSWELNELIGLAKNLKIYDEHEDELERAAHGYRQNGFYDELSDCSAESEFDDLIGQLASLSKTTRFNFSGALQIAESDKGDFLESESRYEDHLYDEWKEERHFRADLAKEVDDLFSSLKR